MVCKIARARRYEIENNVHVQVNLSVVSENEWGSSPSLPKQRLQCPSSKTVHFNWLHPAGWKKSDERVHSLVVLEYSFMSYNANHAHVPVITEHMTTEAASGSRWLARQWNELFALSVHTRPTTSRKLFLLKSKKLKSTFVLESSSVLSRYRPLRTIFLNENLAAPSRLIFPVSRTRWNKRQHFTYTCAFTDDLR